MADLDGTPGDDVILGTPENDRLDGQAGNDRIEGDDGEDLLIGGEGSDLLIGDFGNDTMQGGTGDDQLIWRNGDGSDLIEGGGGFDRVGIDMSIVPGTADPAANDDTAEIALAGGGTMAFARTELNGQTDVGLFALDIRETEEMLVEFGGGDDLAIVSAVAGAGEALLMDAGEGNDTLDLSGIGFGVQGRLEQLFEGGDIGSTIGFGEDGGEAFLDIRTVGFENITGGAGDDNLIGNGAANILRGGDGSDLVLGADGDDTMIGDRGGDSISAGSGDDLIVWNNGDGSDFVEGGGGLDTQRVNMDLDPPDAGGAGNADVAEIAVDEEGRIRFARTELDGSTERGLFSINADVEIIEVNTGFGDDTARLIGEIGGGEAVRLNAGEGTDTIDASAMTPGLAIQIAGLEGGDGFIQQNDGSLNILMTGFENAIGTGGDDSIGADERANRIEGNDGNDLMAGNAGDDTLVGDRGDDTLLGEAGDDLMVWNNGDGSDLMDGGEGEDTVQVNFDLADPDEGEDGNADVAAIGFEGLGVSFARSELNGQTERGLFALDIVRTEALEVNFGFGDDMARLAGGVASEIAIALDGGAGTDTLDFADYGQPVEVVLGEDGSFSNADGAVTTALSFENAIGSGMGDRVTGTEGANSIAGLGGDDVILAGGGDDTLAGGDGNDLLVGGSGIDTVSYEGAFDQVLLNLNFQVPAGQVAAVASGDVSAEAAATGGAGTDLLSGIENAIGGRAADVIRGTLGDNVIEGRGDGDILFGRSGNDLVRGEDGDDLLFGGNDDDTVEGGAGNDRISGQTGDDQLFGGDGADVMFGNIGEDTMDGGAGDDTLDGGIRADLLSGGAGNDELRGFFGNDSLDGGAGDDVLIGDLGFDTMTGGEGADIFVFRPTAADRVTDFDVGQDTLVLGGVAVESLSDLAIAQVGDDTFIVGRPGQGVTLEDTDATTLTLANFDSDGILG